MSCSCYDTPKYANCTCIQALRTSTYIRTITCAVPYPGNAPPSELQLEVEINPVSPKCPCELDCPGADCILETVVGSYPVTFDLPYTEKGIQVDFTSPGGCFTPWSLSNPRPPNTPPDVGGTIAGGLGWGTSVIYEETVSYNCKCTYSYDLIERECKTGPECSPPPPPPSPPPTPPPPPPPTPGCINGGWTPVVPFIGFD